MNKKPYLLFPAIGVFLGTLLLLLYPSLCLSFAFQGLNLWFEKMIPALFPFMVLSGIMIRMNLTDAFVRLARPVLFPLFRVSSACLYVILTGFLCGFPMGASVTAQLYERNRLSKKEAEFLLAFCNNIGPVYFISFALPSIGIRNLPPALLGMYGLPLLYGLFLRYSYYRCLSEKEDGRKRKGSESFLLPASLLAQSKETSPSFWEALDDSVTASLFGIGKLGGYMVLFNLLNALPYLLFQNETIKALCGCLLEITGGIGMLKEKAPFFVLCLLPFGGLSCIAQTYSMMKGSDLSLSGYLLHKAVLTGLSCLYYTLFWRKIGVG